MPPTQENRPVVVCGPLAADELLFHRLKAVEELGRGFTIELDLLSENTAVKPEDVLGQRITVHFELEDGSFRYFDGFVTSFGQTGWARRQATYRATLRPWLWFLTRTTDCRIFQEMTVPAILKQVFRDFGFSDFKEELSGSYRDWTYCVQYRETAHEFVRRLMEQEGIYSYFEHEDGKHTLVLADSVAAHKPLPGRPSLPFFPPGDEPHREDHIHEWVFDEDVKTGTYVLRDFDFEKPKADLLAKRTSPRKHEHAEYEMYDYPGEYLELGDGENYVRARLDEHQGVYRQTRGAGNARQVHAGGLFTLKGHPRDDQNQEYLIVSAEHELTFESYESGGKAEGVVYANRFRAIPSSESFRAARATPMPTVRGPQTATVVGPSGDEIYTDAYGRVKVQFHWDRYGKSDENSSCWIRVAQVWAGKTWGGIHIPRIGQEVIVDFLEGDPDRPIITGRVYNADNMPPYALPANRTQSGIKSRSSKGGSGDNFNEIRFEDKKGSEQVYLHAEKDEAIVVENDKTEDVGHDETISIGNDRTETVGHDETITVGNNRTDAVGVDETRSVGSNRTRSVGKNETVTVGLTRTHTVGINEAITVGAAQEVTVGAMRTVTVGASQSTSIGASHSESVGKNHSVEVGDSETVKIAKKLMIDAGDEVLIKTGKASILMKKDGTITIKGKNIKVEGSGKIDVKASKNVTIKGKKILEN